MKVGSPRDGDRVLCVETNCWIDLERCYRCPALRKVRSTRVSCATSSQRAVLGPALSRMILSGR
jgi:hypothetical protein